MFAKLQFVDYYVNSIEYKSNPFRANDEPELILKPMFDYDIKYKDDEYSEALIEISVNIGDKELNSCPFFASSSVSGIFKLVDSDIPKEEKLNYYRLNALAILFPYLRSIISDITSKGSETPLILPTINIVSLFNKIDEEKAKNQNLRE